MGRWQPDARGRLGQAAMELYGERGYEQTTVAEIADRAGLTARTFFRYFTDKREVLFAGSDALGERLLVALDAAPATDAPFTAVMAALSVVSGLIGDDREHSCRRQAVITANAELKERELAKLATWSAELAGGLRRRGVSEPAASLAAETGVAVFRVAFDRWLAGPDGPTLVATLDDSVEQLRSVTTAG
jgi:AcrR family transcriptional regulator